MTPSIDFFYLFADIKEYLCAWRFSVYSEAALLNRLKKSLIVLHSSVDCGKKIKIIHNPNWMVLMTNYVCMYACVKDYVKLLVKVKQNSSFFFKSILQAQVTSHKSQWKYRVFPQWWHVTKLMPLWLHTWFIITIF